MLVLYLPNRFHEKIDNDFDYKAKCYSKNEGKDLNTRIDTANSGAPY